MDEEEWRSVPITGMRYQASSLGRVRSVKEHKQRGLRGRVLTPYLTSWGYRRVNLCVPNGTRGQKQFLVHALVADAFIGPLPDGHQINHKNGDKCDNRPSNLEYVTPLENVRHAHATGLADVLRGERHGRAKLTQDDVISLRHKRDSGTLDVDEESARLGVSRAAIYSAATRRSWKHLK